MQKEESLTKNEIFFLPYMALQEKGDKTKIGLMRRGVLILGVWRRELGLMGS